MADNGSSGMTAIVAIVAIIIILGLGYFFLQSAGNAGDAGGGADINVDLPTGDGQ